MYIYIFVYICTHIYVCIYIFLYVYIQKFRIFSFVHMFIHVYMCMCKHEYQYIYTSTHIHLHVYMNTYMHTCVQKKNYHICSKWLHPALWCFLFYSINDNSPDFCNAFKRKHSTRHQQTFEYDHSECMRTLSSEVSRNMNKCIRDLDDMHVPIKAHQGAPV